MTYLKDDIVNDYYEFQLLNNPLAQVPSTRNEFCIDILRRAMPYALGRVYAESVLPNNSKVTLIHMHMYVCVCTYMHVCTCMCTCMYMYVSI